MNPFGSHSFKYWQSSLDQDDVVWLSLDCKDKAVNALNSDALHEFITLLRLCKKMPELSGVVITSAKPKHFIAGADVKELSKLSDHEALSNIIRLGRSAFLMLSSLTVPTVALIPGLCLGGGLELALACRYRIMSIYPSGRIGLPEVKIGLIPGWGGIERMILQIGTLSAMPLLLGGRVLRPIAAKKLGLVDLVIPERFFTQAVRYCVNKQPVFKRARPWLEKLLPYPLVRSLLGRFFRKELMRKKVMEDHYPAPYALIECWERYATSIPDKVMVECLHKLTFQHATSRQLLHVLELQIDLKSVARDVKPIVRHVHVVGAGTMGAGIAAWCVMKGMYVTLQDREYSAVCQGIKKISGILTKRLRDVRFIRSALDRLVIDVRGHGVAHADLVIEAVFEDLNLKQTLFADLEKKVSADAILATNTSSFELEAISELMEDKGRLIGVHFFNPVDKMPLVEVIHGRHTNPAYLQSVLAEVRALGKLPIAVRSHPGFLVNRVLMPYLMEATRLLQEGYAPAQIDQVMVDFGMPMGPIELMDTIGLDVCLAVAEHLPIETEPALLDFFCFTDRTRCGWKKIGSRVLPLCAW